MPRPPQTRRPTRHLARFGVPVVACAVDELFFVGLKHAHTARFAAWALPTWAGALVVLAVAVLLVFRHRAPIAVFATTWVVACATLLFHEWLFFACLTVALYVVAATSPRTVAVAAAAVCVVPVVLQSSAITAGSLDPTGELLVRLGLFTLVLGMAWALGRYHHAAAARVVETAARHDAESAAALQQERLRLGRELHDIVSHTVSVMTLQAAGARTLVGRDDGRVVGSLDVIEQAGVQAMSELNRLLTVMRAEGVSEVDPLEVQPRLEDLPRLVELAKASGQDVELDLTGEPGQLDPSVALACYRVVQEALTNARKYAGAGALVKINLTWRPPRLVVTVANDPGIVGGGHDVAALSTGHGLQGLQERVDLVGGELETGPTSGGGYLIRATLPVAATGVVRAPVAGADPARPDPAGAGPTGAWSSFD